MSISERINALKRKTGKPPYRPYVVGDQDGNVQSILPGKVLVREMYGPDQYGPPVSVWIPEVSLSLQAGNAVTLGVNEKNEQYIKGIDHAHTLAQGIEPSSITQAPSVTTPYSAQNGDTTLKLVANDGLVVGLQGWNPIIGGVFYPVWFPEIDLEPSLPSTGLLCYAVIGVLGDLSDVEVQTSTPRAVTDLALDADDVNEALALLSANTTPAWAYPLNGDLTSISQDDIDTYAIDLRQEVNNATGTDPTITVDDGSTTVTSVTQIDFTGDAAVTAGGAGHASVAVSGASAGAKRATMWGDEFLTLSGTLARWHDTSQNFACYFQNNPALNGDSFSSSFVVTAGTYTISVLCVTSTDTGKIDIAIDSVVVGSVDTYTSGTTYNQVLTITSVSISAGYHQLTGTINGKNGSSSGYKFYVTKIWLHQAAD